MITYHIRWEEDIEAESPLDAVTKARELLYNRRELTFFTVTTERGDEMEFDVTTGQFRYTRQIPEHKHNFTGDEDTCTVYQDCPVTWGERMAQITKTGPDHIHLFKNVGSWPSGPDETTTLRRCSCGEEINATITRGTHS